MKAPLLLLKGMPVIIRNVHHCNKPYNNIEHLMLLYLWMNPSNPSHMMNDNKIPRKLINKRSNGFKQIKQFIKKNDSK